jgi:hypothetical protein
MPDWGRIENQYGVDFVAYLKSIGYPDDPVTKELSENDGYPGIEIIHSAWKAWNEGFRCYA